MKSLQVLPNNTPISYLTVLYCFTERDKHGISQQLYKCKCICGTLVNRSKSYLHSCINSNKIMSCGCKHPIKIDIGKKSKKWKGYGDISGFYFAETKMNAQQRNLEFTITIEDMWNQYLKQDKKCALTKLPIFFADSQRRPTIEQTASIDRIDSNKGYTIDNIQVVHKDINRMKNWYSQDRFIEICKLVAANN